MQTGGADIIEVGVPFSGPIADRPAIQETNLVALQNRVDYGTIFAQIKSRSEQRPYVFGYYNPILAHSEDSKRHPDSARNMYTKAGLSYVPLVAPTSLIGSHCRPLHLHRPACKFFLYVSWTLSLSEYAYHFSQMGTTGTSVKRFVNEFPDIIVPIRKHTSVPLAVGFGIVTPGADSVVVGGRIVSLIKEAPAGKVPRVVEDSRNHRPPTPSLPDFKARTTITPSFPGCFDRLK
ncbi:hypothetical protein BKA82DRAFT_24640 [Pisolithus tinctorius]|nr:hypothetical protein BKA82DRAFT_24640 [Pisolithus tinctorius]